MGDTIKRIEAIPVGLPFTQHEGQPAGFGGKVWKTLDNLLVRVETSDGSIDAELYTVNDDGGFSPPSETYLGHILRGLEAAGYDEEALDAVRRAAGQAAKER